MCNSFSPKAWGLAEVVYFVEMHLKCRHSNRGNLKEQWSNHKGFTPWGTKNSIKILWSHFFGFWFFFPFCLISFSGQWKSHKTERQFMLYGVLHRLSYHALLLSFELSCLNLQRVKCFIFILRARKMECPLQWTMVLIICI